MESKVPAWRLSSTHCGGRRAPREEDTGARDKGPAVPRRCAAGTECPIQRRDGEGSAVLQPPLVVSLSLTLDSVQDGPLQSPLRGGWE